MKRICKNCGNVVKGKGKFCDKCGAELVEDENIIDTTVQEKKRRKWPVVIAAILVVCIAVSSVILLSGHTAASYKKILNATQKTIQTSTYFTINSSDGDGYGYLEIDPDAGTVYFYIYPVDDDSYIDNIEVNYKYGRGTMSSDGSTERLDDSLTLMCEALLSFAENGDTDKFYEWFPYTQWFEGYFNLYGEDVETDKLKEAGHDLYKRLSTKDSLEQVMHYEKETKNKVTSYYFYPDDAAVSDEIFSVVKPLYSDKEIYNNIVARHEDYFDKMSGVDDSIVFWVDSSGCLRGIDINSVGNVVIDDNSYDYSSYFTITFDSYDEE